MDYESVVQDIQHMETKAWYMMHDARIYDLWKYDVFLEDCRQLRTAITRRLKEQACAAS